MAWVRVATPTGNIPETSEVGTLLYSDGTNGVRIIEVPLYHLYCMYAPWLLHTIMLDMNDLTQQQCECKHMHDQIIMFVFGVHNTWCMGSTHLNWLRSVFKVERIPVFLITICCVQDNGNLSRLAQRKHSFTALSESQLFTGKLRRWGQHPHFQHWSRSQLLWLSFLMAVYCVSVEESHTSSIEETDMMWYVYFVHLTFVGHRCVGKKDNSSGKDTNSINMQWLAHLTVVYMYVMCVKQISTQVTDTSVTASVYWHVVWDCTILHLLVGVWPKYVLGVRMTFLSDSL